jgi:hypothetical protein
VWKLASRHVPSDRIRKLAYAAVEYDLAIKSLCAMKGQVIAGFTIDYRIKDVENTDYVSVCPWNLYFSGSVYRDEEDVGSILISPNIVVYDKVKANFSVLIYRLLFGPMFRYN